ncbi:1-acyl-sn-glycerol-3-phosphate acyltransferase [Fulvivirga lutea]|uniref:1-acyl-sn-glycerol-3-phosphate acyltransferase n=1 Tax=Fulvivirga lutea TaxID=2810512 RepID=A0A974WF64_9BACT|nr:1-acyl-sn-glycerol-3-phosphate acyltransferase [Fulvivirga lutea]QSE96338.1 1-acyl-sn-glycerol-3-phosphate acyltransferase [Fulvivirga lutea]
MIISLFNLIFKWKGWKLFTPCPAEAHNCVMLAAPHTSNWDFVYAMVALKKLGLKPRFTIKKEFNKPLIGAWIQSLGALWIDRSPKVPGQKRRSMIEVMVELIKESKEPLTVLVTPEGTRSKTEEWKTGFYYTALEAKVPICLAFMDYKKRITGVGQCFMPSGDINADMKIIMDFYKNKAAKFPENFSVDKRYS